VALLKERIKSEGRAFPINIAPLGGAFPLPLGRGVTNSDAESRVCVLDF